jgi:osmotically-inducible protein OsmY
MSDNSLQQAVIDELDWDPRVHASEIGVTVHDGVVTLKGHARSFMEKHAAEDAAGRVAGVKAVAGDLTVTWLSDKPVGDPDIAERAVNVLAWDVQIPADSVKVKVENGWVTLSGELNWHYQSSAAEADVRNLHGVLGVTNKITLKPSVAPADVRAKIKAALDRNAQVEASKITVSAEGGKVTLSGNVDSWSADNIAVTTAWSAPGVTSVVDHMTIG